MISGGDNNWWKKAVASGEIRGPIMHHKDTAEGTYVWPYGEQFGQCTKDEYVSPGEEALCNAALIKWEGKYLVVKSPDGDTYRFKNTPRVPLGKSGEHTLQKSDQLFLKEKEAWPSADACILYYLNFSEGLAPLALREVVYHLHHGATRCLTSQMETIPAPKPEPEIVEPLAAPVVAEPPAVAAKPAEAPKPKPKPKKMAQANVPKKVAKLKKAKPKKANGGPAPLARPEAKKVAKIQPKKEEPKVKVADYVPPPPLLQMCQEQLPDHAKELWASARMPELAELEKFRGFRCGIFYNQSQKGMPPTRTPEMALEIDMHARFLILTTNDGPQRFEINEDGSRIFALHENPAKWMIPPHMNPLNLPTGPYGPIEMRIAKTGELVMRYAIPSTDNTDYTYAWAIARRGQML